MGIDKISYLDFSLPATSRPLASGRTRAKAALADRLPIRSKAGVRITRQNIAIANHSRVTDAPRPRPLKVVRFAMASHRSH